MRYTTTLSRWEDQTLADYLDGPEDDTWHGPSPVELIEVPDTYKFRDREMGRYVTAADAVEIMKEAGYTGWELGEAEIIAREKA